jgi:hypothetical protein
MNLIKRWMYLPVCICIIFLFFIIISLFDILLAVFYSRFYSTAAFVVTFGVGGVFAAFFCYAKAAAVAGVKSRFTRWTILILIWITALLFIFLLSALEGGEYKAAFIAYGITLALTSLLFVKGDLEI